VERELRLRREGDVRAARSHGRAVAAGPLVIRYLPNDSRPSANRYAIIAGRKSGGAVQRNRLKRVTREALRELHPQLRFGFDVAVIIRGTVEELPSSAIAKDLLCHILRRAQLLTGGASAEQPDEP
jgi:ribonuclease P protein component